MRKPVVVAQWYPLILFMAILLSLFPVYASKVTVDADGGADYSSVDAVLALIEAESIDPDTVLIIGDDQDTYSWSTSLSTTAVGTIVFRGLETSPNQFPIINKSGNRSWDFYKNTNVYFENLLFSSPTTDEEDDCWTNAQSTGKVLCFRKCIIRDLSSSYYFLKMEGGASNTVILENCLFEGNGKIFTFDYWNGSPTITITNCTFDGNTELFDFSANGLPATTTNISLKNCIFSNNTATFPSGDGATLKGLTSYSLTSESTSGYGTGCVSNSNPSYVTSSRNNPTDWMIQSGSPAQNIGTTSGAPSTDINGYTRSSPDAGCWEYQTMPDNYATWSYSTTITLNTTSGGANVSGNVLNFPVLIRLNPATFSYFSQTLAGGADIRFAKTDGTHLPYQIERWYDGSSNIDTADIWVKLDTVYGNNATQSFIMLWGKTGAADSSSSTTVFNSGNSFFGVWHLNESSGNVEDATNNNYDGSRNGNQSRITGTIGYGQSYDGSGDYSDMGDYMNLGTNPFTLSTWVKRGSTGQQTIMCKSAGGNPGTWYGYDLVFNGSNQVQLFIASGGTNWGDGGTLAFNSTAGLTDLSSWHHIAVSIERSATANCKMYIDGTEVATGFTGYVSGVGSIATSERFRLGSESDGDYQLNAYLDEARVETTNRSADWVKLCYQNQRSSQTLVVFGDDYTWDTDAGSGITPDDGTWGSDNYWTLTSDDGTSLVAWPGAGNSATFGGVDGTYAITVSGTQYVDSITFQKSGYTISGGTAINFGSRKGIYVASTESGTIATPIAGTGGITKYGAGTLIFSGTHAYTGTTAINLGELSIGNGGTTGAISNSSPIDVSGTLTFDRSDDYTYTGVISGAGAIVKEGAGTVTLSGNLTYSGVTTVNDGTLRLTGTPTSNARTHVINSGGTLSVISHTSMSTYPASFDADWLTINGGTLSTAIITGQEYGANRGFTLGASGGTIDIPNTDNSNTVRIVSVISGSGALTKTGVGVLSFSGTNTFSGGVTVSEGVLRAENTAALGNSSNTITVSNGGCIDVYGTNLQAYTNNITINGQVSSDTGALANFGSDQQNAIRKIALGSNASIGNNGGGRFDIGRGYEGTTCITGNGYTLTKVGNNLVSLPADGSNIGSVVVNGGTLRLEDVDAVGTAAITVNSSGAVDSWNSLTFTNDLVLNGGTLASVEDDAYNTTWSGAVSVTDASTLACSADNTTTLSGAITGTGSLTVSGIEGVMLLSGNSNEYSGGTTVSGATLRITNTSNSATGTGAVSVANGAILDGTGTIGGALNMAGTLSPGIGGPGTLTVGDDVTFTSDGIFSVQADGTTPDSEHDQLIMSNAGGTVTLDGATLSFTFGGMPEIDDYFIIIDNQGSDPISGTFNGITQGGTIIASFGGVGFDCIVTYNGGTGNDVVVTVDKVSSEVYATDWAYSQVITLNTTATGANVSGGVADFPVLLRLNPGNFDGFANTQPGGADIRFALSDGTKLNYEIERWKDYDFDQDTAEIWVKLDTVIGNNKSQSFIMYWGKPDAADSSDGGAVFDTDNGFIGVWHLNEDPSGGSASVKDATANALHATPVGSMTASDLVDGVIGKGHDFDGSNDADSIPYDAALNTRDSVTLSAWVNVTAFQLYSRIISRGMPTNADPWSIYSLNTNDVNPRWRGEVSNGASGLQASVLGVNDLSTGTWYYVTLTYDRDTIRLYRNGVRDGGSTRETDTMPATQTTPLMIGKTNWNTNPFSGKIDEVRASKTARSVHWIKLCYENQRTSQTLVLYEDYTTWGFSRNITINTSGVTTTDCIDFPLLVRLTSTNFDFNQADDDGDDIRFSNADGTPLRYQIERWVKGSTVAEIWVRVDTVFADDASQYITMYWGKRGVSSRSSASAVFDTSNGFTGVWHMNQASGSTSDATVNALNGTANGGVAYSQTGTIGSANGFDGDGDYFNHGNNAILQMDASDKVTVSAWVKRTGGNVNSTAEEGIAGKFEWSTGNYREYMIINNASSGFRFVISSDGTWSNETSLASNIVPINGTWYYVTGVMGAGNMYIFTDGVQRNSTAKSAIYGSTNANFNIGMMDDNGSARQYFNGTIDEVRVEKTNRSADWIKLCYETQKPIPDIITIDSADAFRPLTIRREMSGSTTDSIIIATKRWAIRFNADEGGGIDFLSADTNSANQLDANLFYFVYNSTSSASGTGTLELLDSSIVFARVRQKTTVSGNPFTVDYSVLGSGKMFVRVSTLPTAALSGGLSFRIANNATANHRNIVFGSTSASSCHGVAHIDSGSGKYDLVMAPYDSWSEADQIDSGGKYVGLGSSTWSSADSVWHAWEFMADFGHHTLADSAKAYQYIADYRNSDTLGFYEGTPLLEQAWEKSQIGQWDFNEGIGTTVADRSGNGHDGTISAGTPSWTSGKWNSGALSLAGSDSVTVPHHTDFTAGKAHTICAWIYPNSLLSSSVAILKKCTSTDVGYGFMGGPSGTIQYRMGNGGSCVELQSTTVLTPGQWYHVAAKMIMILKQDYLALYINGELDTLRAIELDSYYGTPTNDVVIGKEFNGVIDDVRFYNNALDNDEIRAISLRGFSPDRGIYRVRADNDNTLHCRMHGNADNRFLPVLQIDNYWSTDPTPYVYVDGVGLTSGSDYYAALDDNRNRLTIGFNRVINRCSAIFIDDNLADGYQRVGETKKMYWGIEGSSDEYFWVKNTAGRYLGAASCNEWYINWKMNNASIKDGEIWQMRSSVTNPYTIIDTVAGTNLIQGTDGYNSDLGAYSIHYSDGSPTTTNDVFNTFTYTVEESSLVRIRLR
ncbi:MAG: DUF2341 domain-containing protein, partial [Chitinispirillaceae bacterium]|nr:DUF2341 domain-containing protein [Chitinispirillaceae bacterium]